MSEVDKLRVLLPHWIAHNGEHAEEFGEWAGRAGVAEDDILAAAKLVQQANSRLGQALEKLGGPLEHDHDHHHHHDHDHA